MRIILFAFSLILAFALLATLCACGGKKAESAVSTRPAGADATEAQTGADTGENEVSLSNGADVGAGLFNVTLTIPAEFAEEMV